MKMEIRVASSKDKNPIIKYFESLALRLGFHLPEDTTVITVTHRDNDKDSPPAPRSPTLH